jgi:hypothetical protein
MLKGAHQSPEAKAKISAANNKRFLNPEERAKISNSLKGEKNPNYGTHHAPEWKAMMSEKAKERLSAPEARAKLSRKRKPLSPEHKAKLSAIGKQRQTSPETRDKMSASRKGKPHSAEWKARRAAGIQAYYDNHPEAKAQISERMKGNKNSVGKTISPENRAKTSQRMKGNKVSSEVRAKISKALMGHETSLAQRERLSLALKGKRCGSESASYGREVSPETRAKLSAAHKGKFTGEKSSMFGKHHTPESKAKQAEVSRKRWANPEYKDRAVKSIIRGSSRRPTTPERVVIEMLKEILPNQYQYVGSGHETVINGCNPDFININGQKKVIEVFGDWYHGERKTGKTHEQEEVDKINTYREFGFDCLVIWEYDTKKHKDEVAKRILVFHRQRHKKPEIQPQLL